MRGVAAWLPTTISWAVVAYSSSAAVGPSINGIPILSVPTIELVLDSKARPPLWKRVDMDNTHLDEDALGWPWEVPPYASQAEAPAEEQKFIYDTSYWSQSNAGHPFGDHLDFCVELIRRVGSPRMKLLFDIYHVQIMHGDIIARLKKHKDWIGHYHTAGVPGRNEIDDTQEIRYAPIMRAIAATGYKGFVGQEFIPLRDPAPSLADAVHICDV